MRIKKWKLKQVASAASVGIIGGADGPTAIFTRPRDKRREREWNALLDKAAAKLTPCDRDLAELGGYLAEKYGAKEKTLSDREQEEIKVNLLLNSYGGYLEPPQLREEEFGTEAFGRWQEEFTERIRKAKQIPQEELGLKMHAYELPPQAAPVEKRRRGLKGLLFDRRQPDRPLVKPVVMVELRSGYCTIQDASEQLADDITLWRGVSSRDIEERTPRFLCYVSVLERRGELS